MAGAKSGKKKKTKATANPNRGFATTSLPSKPRVEIEAPPPPPVADNTTAPVEPTKKYDSTNATVPNLGSIESLSPEDYEKYLEQSELQLLIEKYGPKVKRDAARQKTRLETDRRLLRSQAEPLNIKRWIPQEFMDEILELIQAEGRYANSSLTSYVESTSKLPPEDDLIMKLWTLREILLICGFSEDKVNSAIKHVLDIAMNIAAPAFKESIWGLEEAFDWFARECSADELAEYDVKGKKFIESPIDSQLPSRAVTPKAVPPTQNLLRKTETTPKQSPSKKNTIAFMEDIEPDELIPAYLDTKEKLFRLHRLSMKNKTPEEETEIAKLNGKMDCILQDVLFDKYAADEKWKERIAGIEKELAAIRKADAERIHEEDEKEKIISSISDKIDSEENVNFEAERIAAEILAETEELDDNSFSGFFDSLPVEEIDSKTGKSKTVMNGSENTRVEIRDFGKWSGVNPRRVLEEACKSRDSGVKIAYSLISNVSFANRHEMLITWTKKQGHLPPVEVPNCEAGVYTDQHYFKMASIATPSSAQSEAFIATIALFFLFGNFGKDEKVALRLPPVWRDMWDELMNSKKEQLDKLDRDVVKSLRTMIREKQDQELEEGVILADAFRSRSTPKTQRPSSQDPSRERPQPDASTRLQQLWEKKTQTPRFQNMLQFRMQLPMWTFKQQVLDTIDRNQVVIVCGETGCGKSTQTPAFILEHELSQGRECKIYCTEPRRISALSLARRVSEELGERSNDVGTSRSLVGYAIRLESKTTRETRLVYATTGIVMRMIEGSNDLSDITHLIIDEVHERTIDSDFLLIILKDLLVRRRDLKVVLMSATVDAVKFSSYLDGAPILNIPGRTFPVNVQYLEDAIELTGHIIDKMPQRKLEQSLDDDEPDINGMNKQVGDLVAYSAQTRSTLQLLNEYQIDFDLVVKLLHKIATEKSLIPFSKAVLVFLPGIAEIRTLNDCILGDPRFQEWLVYPLHSTVATEEQEEAFLVPPEGKRKIVLATNIAETGITIPDVTCVIDTGIHREMRFDERKQMSRLIDTFISRANAKQRRGRAGRVQEGLCYHMFTRYRHDKLMSDQQTPEMLRLSLQELAIRVKTCKIGNIEETLSGALDPPSAKNIRRAVEALVEVRALTSGGGELTPLGYQLARLPVDVFLGKLILFGTLFKCLDMALTVAAILSVKSPFVAPWGERAKADKARMGYARADSDLLTIYNAYLAWKRVSQSGPGNKVFQFCQKNYLSASTLSNIEDTKGSLLEQLADSGFLSLTDDERRSISKLRYSGRRRNQAFYELPHRTDGNSENNMICASVIGWSFYPKLLVRENPGSKGLRNIWNNQYISVHPSSVNKHNRELKWISYYHIMQSKTFYNAHETTAIDPFAIALLSGEARMDMYTGTVTVDGHRARFSVSDWKSMLVLKVLRARLREIMVRSFKSPAKLTQRSQGHERWFEVWQRLFALQDQMVKDTMPSRGIGAGVGGVTPNAVGR